jgi:hypothetical protein
MVFLFTASIAIPHALETVEGKWFFEPIELGGDVGVWTSITVDSRNVPHVSYFDANKVEPKYAFKEGENWIIESIGAYEFGGSWNSISLGSDDRPRVVYESINPHVLKYAEQQDAVWAIESVHSELAYRHTSIEVKENGEVVVVFYVEGTGGLFLGRRVHGNWNLEKIDDDGYGCSLALDNSGLPHIAYFNSRKGTVIHAYRDDQIWQFVDIETIREWTAVTDIYVDDWNRVHISFVDGGDLKYYVSTGLGSLLETVDRDIERNIHGISLAVDSGGDSHLVYIKGDTLFYAVNDDNDWFRTRLLGASVVASMCLDSEGLPHISFYRSDDEPGPEVIGNLWYATKKDTEN